MTDALAIVRDKLRHYPDHGATDPVVKYVLTGTEMAIIHDALARIPTPRAAITLTPDTSTDGSAAEPVTRSGMPPPSFSEGNHP